MANPEEINNVLNRIVAGEHTDADIAILRKVISSGDRQVASQLGKYNVNIGDGKEIHIGNCIYNQWDDQAIQALLKAIQQTTPKNVPTQFQSLIADKTEEFVGREYVFGAIEAFIANNSKGYFTIIGDPGLGKRFLRF